MATAQDLDPAAAIAAAARPLHETLADSAQRYAHRPAIRFYKRELTYRDLAAEVERLAGALHGLGIGRGDRVSIMLPNCPQCVVAFYAVLRLGAIAVMTNPLYTGPELAFHWRDSGATACIAVDLVYPTVLKARGEQPMKTMILTRISDYFPWHLRLAYGAKTKVEQLRGKAEKPPAYANVRWWRDLTAEAKAPPPAPELDPHTDLALLQYTGGTTGVPKAAMLTHANLSCNAIQCVEFVPSLKPGEERFLAVMPLFHCYGLTLCLNLAIRLGACVLPVPRFVPGELLKVIADEKPSIFPGVPAMYNALLRHPEVKNYNLHSVRLCVSGAAAMPVAVMKEFETVTGARVVEGYGLTECSPIVCINPVEGIRKAGTIGLAITGTTVAVLDPATGEEVPRGEVGELAVKGPQVMKGYWNQPDETAHAMRNGWLFTGDMATEDEDGYFAIVDRAKDMINVGGLKVFPREVEEVLHQHPAVSEASAIAIPVPIQGEAVKAYIILRPGAKATSAEIKSFCEERLARYKVPVKVEFVTELPKTMIGKVLRRKLREQEDNTASVNSD